MGNPGRARPSAIAGIGMVVGVNAIAALTAGCGETGSASATVTQTVAAADASTVDTAEATSADAPAAQQLRGSGMRVMSINVATSTPLVIKGSNTGSSNFIVHLLGGGTDESVFNEIGPYTGTTLITELGTGRYRVKVEAEGAWTLDFTQPTPPSNATPIPGAISGKGAKVVWVRADEDLQPIITGRHRGESNFIVHIVSPDGMGEESLFNEIGAFSGETTTDIPASPYMVSVQADGSWSLKFAR